MRIVFSRKGFDSAAGGGPSPIVDGRPLSLPIPTAGPSRTTYDDLGLGDVFVFFGLFREEVSSEPHHRVFGYLRVEEVIDLATCAPAARAALAGHDHPHAIAMHAPNDTIYRGEGATAATATAALRLTVPGGTPSIWQRPHWLRPGGLSYHDRADRWLPGGRLRAVSRGQEFVADIGRRKAPREWLANVIAAIRAT